MLTYTAKNILAEKRMLEAIQKCKASCCKKQRLIITLCKESTASHLRTKNRLALQSANYSSDNGDRVVERSDQPRPAWTTSRLKSFKELAKNGVGAVEI